MILPRKIIFWVAAFLPLLAVAPHFSWLNTVISVLLAVFVALCAWDAVSGLRKAGTLSLWPDDVIRLNFLRKGRIRFHVKNASRAKVLLIFNPYLPDALKANEEISTVEIPENERSEFEIFCVPRKRGRFDYDKCFFETQSPLGLWSVRLQCAFKSQLKVYPDIMRDAKSFAALSQQGGIEGMHRMHLVGQGRDFEKLREYQPGDGYDIIAWKATARKARPISKVFQMERTQKVYAVIDCSRLSAKKSEEGLASIEYYLSSALLLGFAAERLGDQFGIIAFDDQVRKFIRAGDGKAHHLACREAIFSLESSRVSPLFENLFSFVKLNIRSRAVLFFLSDIAESSIAEEFMKDVKIICKQHLCILRSVRDAYAIQLFDGTEPRSTEEIYSRLAGHVAWAELLDLKRRLAGFGVTLGTSVPKDFTGALVGDYMTVKKRQLA